MECLTVVLSTLAAKPLEAVGRLLCRPCNDEIQNSIEVLSKPETLDDDLRELSNMAHEIRGMRSSDEIKNWVSEADKILRECSSSNHADDRQSCCCFSSNARLRYNLHKKIKRLMGQGKRIIACASLMLERVMPIRGAPDIKDDTTAGKNLKKVMDELEDDAVWMIGLWGPGGVGKTTLAQALNNRLRLIGTSFLVIFISLTQDASVETMQKAIAERLKETVEAREPPNVAEKIHNRLQKEKFLLILDNVWKSFDLSSIGIPQKQEASKIILTTRDSNVCREMGAKTLEIGLLTVKEAWKLFAEKAGDVVKNEEIQPLAETVCQECGGLPLAVITVGLAMREKTNICLWKSAINRLREANFIRGDESPVNRALKLSYDWLEDNILRRCFLYCSLYPEGYAIDLHKLVGCWLAEKVIDEQLYYGDAFNEVLDLIEKLTSSCLLEKTTSWSDEDGSYYVKMHDVVRDFARWIAEQNGCMILSGHGISKDPAVKFPEEVNNLEWISFVDNKEMELPQHTKDFPKVTTLLLHGSRDHRVEVLHEFLEGFQKLRVLNMQEVLSFPGSSLCLAELRAIFCSYDGLLRYRPHVEEIPCMPKLIILDLSGCPINKIPRGVRELTHLKVLNLSRTLYLESVEVDTISNLTSLEVLDMRLCGYEWPTKRKSNSKEATLQDLSELKKLKSVYLDLADKECSYEDCKWMESLENFHYLYWVGSLKLQTPMGKEMTIRSGRESGEAGSFVLHAESLALESLVDVDKIFLNSNSIDRFNSKLKRLWMSNCTFSRKSIGPAPNCIALSHLETLLFSHGHEKDELSFSQIADSLGTTFSKLRLLEVYYSNSGEPSIKAKNFISSNDPQMELPELEEIILIDGKNMIEVFHYGPTENHVVAPNLRRLKIIKLPMLERLCNYELTEQWQSLEILDVWGCPNLKKLPKMPCIKEIRGEVSWWNNLEWDSLDTKSAMDQIFKSSPHDIDSDSM